MAANQRTPLLGDRELRYTVEEHDRDDSRVSTADSQLTALAEELGLKADELSGASTERDKDGTSGRRRNGPVESVVTITREQLEDLQNALETTSDLIRQVGMNSMELDALSRQRKHHRIPRCVTNNLLLLTVLWQVLNIAAVSIAEAFESESTGEEKSEEKNIFLVSIIIIVVFQALNLILVSFTTIKLTKQIMHQTVTKSFLAQSFLSTTILYAGLYTLVYKLDQKAFNNLSPDKSALKTPLVFFKMTFFSISTATLCGMASVVPAMWSAQLIASAQMFMSYVYFASTLYLAVQPRKSDLTWKIISRSNHSIQKGQTFRRMNQRVV